MIKKCGVAQSLKHVMHVWLCNACMAACDSKPACPSLREPSMFALKAPDGIKKCDSSAEQENTCFGFELRCADDATQ